MKDNRQPAINRGEGLLAALLSDRVTLVELLIVGLLLAIGVHLVSAVAPALFGWSPLTTFAVGFVVCVSASALLVIRLYRQLNSTTLLEAFVLYDMERDDLISVPHYEYSEHLARFFKGAFAENPALKTIWQRDPFRKAFTLDAKTKTYKYRPTEAGRLVREATEYYIIDSLSTHLTDYFNDDQFEESRLLILKRGDIPDVLLSNRFMELFSRPIDQRQAFVNSLDEHSDSVAMESGEHGELYSRFDLTLPDRGRVMRLPDHSIEITTRRLKLTISTEFQEMTANLPSAFVVEYLHLMDNRRYHAYSVSATLTVKFRVGALLTRRGWEYYKWVDSFIQKLTHDIAQSAYFECIGWDAALTVIQVSKKTVD